MELSDWERISEILILAMPSWRLDFEVRGLGIIKSNLISGIRFD
jgi:hypothetical protein